MAIHTIGQTGSTYDDTALKEAIATLTANEAADDATVAALDAIVKAIPSAKEQVNVPCVADTTIDMTTLTLDKNQRVFAYSMTGLPISIKVRFNRTFGKTLSAIGTTPTFGADPALATIPNMVSACIYRDFALATATNGKTYIWVEGPVGGTGPAFSAINTDSGLATWQASAKSGDYVQDARDGAVWVSKGPGVALKLTSNSIAWISDDSWFDSDLALGPRYVRQLVGFTSLTLLELEFRDNSGAIQQFTLNDFTTSFANNGFWNTTPQGVTRLVPTGVGQANVAVVLEKNKTEITLCVQDLAFGSTDPKRWLQFRNVKLNGRPADNRLGDSAIAANATAIASNSARITALESAAAAGTRVVDTRWYNTSTTLADRFYKPVNKATLTSLSFEYKRPDGTIGTFSNTDFATGFVYSSFWNGGSDPSGLTKSFSQGESIVLSFNGAGDRLTIFCTSGSTLLQIRKIAINGVLEYLTTYDPSPLIDRVGILGSLFGWATGVEINTGMKYGTKDVFMQVWEGTTPTGTNDNTLVSIAGATRVVNFEGFYKESNADRTNLIGGAYSGSAAHGALFKWYAKTTAPIAQELHVYNNTADTRHSGCPYLVRAWYIK